MYTEGLVILLTSKTMGAFFHWSLFLLFLYLRLKGDKEALTLSQRWALTLLIWLFLLNSISLTAEFFIDSYLTFGEIIKANYLRMITSDLDVMIGTTLLALGLVFPRPYTSWKKLQLTLVGLYILTFIMVGVQIGGHSDPAPSYFGAPTLSGYAYIFGWFIPVVLWLPLYEKETSVHSKMVLTLLIWGYITTALSHGIPNFILLVLEPSKIGANSIISMLFMIYIVVRMVTILWKRRRDIDLTDRINIGFLCFISLSALVQVVGSDDAFSFLIYHLSENFSWTVLRPALFSYAILRFQIFGPRLKVDRPLSFIVAMMGCLSIMTLTVMVPFAEPLTRLAIGAVIALVAFLPVFKLSKDMVIRFMPMTTGETSATMREKRATYLIGLQTAIVNGEMDNTWDETMLARQRKILGISRREHDLLMDSFAMREGKMLQREMIDELFLVNLDGRLMVHVGEKGSDAKDKDMDIVAGMLMAIRDYVKEGLRSSKAASLDSIRYGAYTLLIETEGRLVLAAVVKGPGSPDLRQHLGDQLALIKRRHGKDLEVWDGDMSKTEGAKHILEGFMEEVELL